MSVKYELPDRKVSLVWSERRGAQVRWCGYAEEWKQVDGTFEIEPEPGDWLPWTPPVFPERVKRRFRRCRCVVRFDGVHKVEATIDAIGGDAWSDWLGRWIDSSCVTDIEWIDPEYLDELLPDPRGAK